jgi:aminopeptidase
MDMQMRNDFAWCLVSIPTPAWALKVFPGLSQEAAVEKLWEAIFEAVRVKGDGGAVRRWEEHAANLNKRADILNEHNFSRLVYKNSLGTDLSVELPEKHKWNCCGEKAGTGAAFVANMPTEEIFTLPKKNGVNGLVCSSMPLSLDGSLVKDIKLTLKEGKITEAKASEGLETLTKKLEVDDGAKYLGEVALVPHKSPISDMGILFYNTLFDENASCHFAFGKAYPCFKDAETAEAEEMEKRGMNDSVVHVDFMVGTPGLSIKGITRDGREVPVFTEGNFAF